MLYLFARWCSSPRFYNRSHIG